MRNRSRWVTAIISEPRRRLVVLLMAVSLSACSGLYFFPTQRLVHSPSDADLAFEDVWIESADKTRLHAWWLPARGEERGVIYFLHGNGENISTHIGSVYWLPAAGYSVLLLDYRGYGLSAGEPELPAVLQDIEAGMAWVLDRVSPQTRVFLFGQSLGAAMSSYVLATRTDWQARLAGAIFDAGFADYADLAQDVASRSWVTWLLQWPSRLVVENRYAMADVSARLQKPAVLYFHSVDDGVVPYRLGEMFYAGIAAPKCFQPTSGPHIATFAAVQNRELLLEFLRAPDALLASGARKGLRCEQGDPLTPQ